MSAARLAVSIHTLAPVADEGLVADAAVFDELGCRAACVATDIGGEIPDDLLARQIDALPGEAGRCAAARIGWVRAGQAARVAAFVARAVPESAVLAILPACLEGNVRESLFPIARVVVVRAVDAPSWIGRTLTDLEDLPDAAARLRGDGARAVLIAGFRAGARTVDLLDDGGRVALLDAPRIAAPHLPGIAGAHAAALAGHLARGAGLRDAAAAAQRYVALRLTRGR